MHILEKTKEEIITKVNSMSDFLKMEYLERCINKFNDPDILKYVYTQLAQLYEQRVMYADALKYLGKLQGITNTFPEKYAIYEKEIELLIKGAYYDRAPNVYKMAIKSMNEIQAMNLRRKIIQWYQREAQKYENTHKSVAALKVYERLIPLLTDAEKTEARKKLLALYKNLGKIKESIELEKMIH